MIDANVNVAGDQDFAFKGTDAVMRLSRECAAGGCPSG